jgi:hypothetical protein
MQGQVATESNTEIEYLTVGLSHQIEWVGRQIPVSINDLTSWRHNPCGHVWQEAHWLIRAGARCPKCYPTWRRPRVAPEPTKFDGV